MQIALLAGPVDTTVHCKELSMMHSITRSTLALLSLVGAVACGQDRPAQTPGTDNNGASAVPTDMASTPSVPPTPTAAATQAAGVTPATTAPTTPAMPPPPIPLTDGQIVLIVTTANSGEIDQAKEAMKKAKDRKVKAFAQHMVTDHGQAGKDLGDISKKAKIEPSQSDVSDQVASDGKGILSGLQSTAAGADFDKQYIDAQVKEHRQLLDALDSRLVASAQNADLKTFLTKVRDKVADHLKMATEIQSSLSK